MMDEQLKLDCQTINTGYGGIHSISTFPREPGGESSE